MKTKRCSKCKIEKNIFDFFKDRSIKKDGTRPICKKCDSIYVNIPKVKKRKADKIKEYRKNPKVKKYFAKKQKEWRDKPENKKKVQKRNLKPHKMKRKAELHLLRKYELTLDDYNKILSKQNNKCAICKIKMEKPNVDHCHKTGIVRGILCAPCNKGLGNFKDNIEYLKEAINYLMIENK